MEDELPAKNHFLNNLSFTTRILSLLRLYLKVTPIPDVKVGVKHFRATNDGGIEISNDDGKTWEPGAGFKHPHHVWGLALEDEQVVAAVQHHDHTILINSNDGKTWYNHHLQHQH